MTARPGPFWPAIVTIISGMEMLMIAWRSKVGVVQMGPLRSHSSAGAEACPVAALRAAPTTTASSTA
nr:hypothetical protein [Arthrobacter castelli]